MIASSQWCRNRIESWLPEPSTPNLQSGKEVTLQEGLQDPLCQTGEILYVLGAVLCLKRRHKQYVLPNKENTILLFLFYVGNRR